MMLVGQSYQKRIFKEGYGSFSLRVKMKKLVLRKEEAVDIERLIDVKVETDSGVYKRVFPTKWGSITLLIFERYYHRIGTDLSITLISDKRENETTVEIIAAGGKTSVLQFDFETEKSATKSIAGILINDGFEILED